MVVKKMVVEEGTCPLCTKPTNKLAEFVNDSCVSPSARIEYRSCHSCKKVWEQTSNSLGVEIVDLRYRIKQMQDDIGSAS